MHILPQIGCPAFRLDGSFPPYMDLRGGQMGTLWLEFRPTSPGAQTCEVSLGSCGQVTVTGVGRVPGDGILSPQVLDFGEVEIGSGAEETFTITNSGSAVISGTITGACGGFSVVGSNLFSLPPAASARFLVRFQPDTVGEHRCTLDAGQQSAVLPLRGMARESVPVVPTTWGAIKTRFHR